MTNETLALLAKLDAIAREMAYQSARFDVLAQRSGVTDRYTVAEAARILQCSAETVRRRFAHVAARVPGGKKEWIPAAAVREAFLAKSTIKNAKRREAA